MARDAMMPRDRRLGDALRAVLTRPDEETFVRRVLARIEESGTWWDVLGQWARPGLAAALLLAVAGGFWLGSRVLPPAAAVFEDAPPAAGTAGRVASLLNAPEPPAVDVILAVVNGQD